MAAATARRLDTPFRGFLSGLMAATSLVSPSFRSPFDGYGVVASGVVAARAKSLSPPKFGVREARDRLSDFIDGAFSPKSLQELMDYLSERFLKLEIRIFDGGRTANYLVDKVSRQAILAASVDPRLSRPGIAKRYGRAVENQVEARRTAAVTPETIDAKNLRARAGGAFRDRRENGTPFLDWDDLAFSSPALFQNRELTVQGNEVWVGVSYDRASSDPERNLRVIARARAEGKKLVFPGETRDSVQSGRLVPGMPILLRDGAVRTKFIDESMTFEGLTRAFGVSPFDHFRAIGGTGAMRGVDGLDAEAKVVQIDEFRRFRKPAAKAPDKAKAVLTEEVASRCVVKHELDGAGRESLSFLDPKTLEEYPFDAASAPVGVFRKEDAFGLPSGYLEVGGTGTYSHFDEQERLHNAYGPAVVPPSGSGGRFVYALDGTEMSSVRFAKLTATAGPESSRPGAEAEAERVEAERARVERARDEGYEGDAGLRHSR